MLAGGGNDLAYIISMAGSTIKGDSLLKLQRYLILKANGASDKQIEENEELHRLFHVVINKHTADSVFNYPDLFVDEIIPEKQKNDTAIRKAYKNELLFGASPELQSILSYDPTEDMQKITCYVLTINGDKDLQVPADVNLNAVKTHVKDKVTVKKIWI